MEDKKQGVMDALDLRIMMMRKGLTSQRLSRHFRVSHRAINYAIKGRLVSLRSRIVKYVETK